MKVDNISFAVLSFFESCIMPQIPTTWGKAMAYAGVLLQMPKFENSLKKYAPMFSNENGDMDLDKVREIGLTVFEKIPKIDIADFDFDRNDFESFISYLSTQG